MPGINDANFSALGDEPGRASPEVTARTVGRAAAWATGGSLVGQVSWFMSLLVLAALVPPAGFGVVAAAMVLVNTANLLVGSGTRGYVITSRSLDAQQVRTALFKTAGAGLVATIIVFLFADRLLAAVLPDEDFVVLQWLFVSVALSSAAIVPVALLERHLRFRHVALIRAGGALVASALAIAAAAAGAGVWALVARQVAASGLVALMATVASRCLLPRRGRLLPPRGEEPARQGIAARRWFFVLATMVLVVFSLDAIVIGRLRGATELGLYSLAFTLAFAPLTQLAWQAGSVLLPAVAATSDAAVLSQRLVRSLRTMGVALLLFVVPAVILAPWVLPLAFGERWTGVVVPFQILLPVGVAHAVISVVGEFLAGSGNVDLHARIHVLWGLFLAPLLIVLVELEGLRGAAIAHALALVPVAGGYLVLGARRLSMRRWALVRALGDLVGAVLVQALTTSVMFRVLADAGLADAYARLLAAAVGFAVALALLAHSSGPLRDARDLASAMLRRST